MCEQAQHGGPTRCEEVQDAAPKRVRWTPHPKTTNKAKYPDRDVKADEMLPLDLRKLDRERLRALQRKNAKQATTCRVEARPDAGRMGCGKTNKARAGYRMARHSYNYCSMRRLTKVFFFGAQGPTGHISATEQGGVLEDHEQGRGAVAGYVPTMHQVAGRVIGTKTVGNILGAGATKGDPYDGLY